MKPALMTLPKLIVALVPPCNSTIIPRAPLLPTVSTREKPDPKSVAVWPLPVESGQEPKARSKSPWRHQAKRPFGMAIGRSGGHDGGNDGGGGGNGGGEGGGEGGGDDGGGDGGLGGYWLRMF